MLTKQEGEYYRRSYSLQCDHSEKLRNKIINIYVMPLNYLLE